MVQLGVNTVPASLTSAFQAATLFLSSALMSWRSKSSRLALTRSVTFLPRIAAASAGVGELLLNRPVSEEKTVIAVPTPE